MELKIGYTVRLKSGGPIMTVSEIEARKVHVAWFNQTDGGVHSPSFGVFKPDMLELISQ
jgi:uncharacterized protein YodC (DUF2158 family)